MFSNSWIIMCFFIQFLFTTKSFGILKTPYLDSTIIQIKGHYLNSYRITLVSLKAKSVHHVWLTELQVTREILLEIEIKAISKAKKKIA